MSKQYVPSQAFNGLTTEQVVCVKQKWYNITTKGTKVGFGSLLEFLMWTSGFEYECGMYLERYDYKKPHSPENSCWTDTRNGAPARKRQEGQQVSKEPDFSPEMCRNCPKDCVGQTGCYAWEQNFKEEWNRTTELIKVALEAKRPRGKMFFRYEHPDLVREGISKCT